LSLGRSYFSSDYWWNYIYACTV